jgi:hypothetical protein
MSMPVTNMDYRARHDLPDLASVLGHIDTASFLFGEEDKPTAQTDPKAFLQMSNKDDFPVLLRRDGAGNGTKLSASSAALDLALSQSPGPDASSNGWHGYRHRQAQQSLPANTFRKGDEYENGQTNGNVETTPNKNNRRSVEFNFSPMNAESKRSSYAGPTKGMPKLTQSFSASDVPTMKNLAGVSGANGLGFSSHAEQHFHNHNASLGRIPPNVLSNRHSRELSTGYSKDQDYRSAQSGLHASAAPFGPAVTSAAPVNNVSSTVGSPTMSQYSSPGNAPYYGYGMSMLNGAMNGLALGPGSGPGPQFGGPPSYAPNGMYSSGSQFNPYATYGPGGRVQDSQARVIQSRRLQNDANKYMNLDLRTMPREDIYSLCKDQHGCRFLQKKLEDRNLEHIQIIFDETAPHVVELMTDPFGNYLCQKLLEFCNDEQRNTLVRNAAPAMVSIALNQHGTRALQKMIEFISTDDQVCLTTLRVQSKS